MKRIFTLLAFFWALTINAQEMPRVAGVEFGWSYNQCKEVLDKRFNGGNSSNQYTPNELYYSDIYFANEYFSYVRFRFQTDKNNTLLQEVSFFASFDLDNAKHAKDKRDRLFEFYNKKYKLRWENTDDDGWKFYVLGEDPFHPENGLIVIGVSRMDTNAGIPKLWTTISYGPIDFVNPLDEI